MVYLVRSGLWLLVGVEKYKSSVWDPAFLTTKKHAASPTMIQYRTYDIKGSLKYFANH